MDIPRHHTIAAVLFLAILGLTALLYWPGLSGDFLLDDDPNLQNLASVGYDDTIRESLTFALDGNASRLGRPVALLSFALQAKDWPDNPAGFKRINVLIHLLNGALIFLILFKLARMSALPRLQKFAPWLALLASSAWLLHPFQVSTVLYVVQRMTQLAVFFSLIAILGYLWGRAQVIAGHTWRGIAIASVTLGLAFPLGMFSKEIAALTLLYIMVIEFTLLRDLPTPKWWRLWLWVCIYTPVLLLIAYFISIFPVLKNDYAIRDFTMAERLLTQTRILVDYLGKILYPLPSAFSLFHDDYVPSRGWLSPPSTLLSFLLLALLFIVALWKRRTWPVFAFSVLWFFAGHVLESSFIGLVLYFEHRNYLPLLGPVFGVLYGVFYLWDKSQTPRIIRLVATLLVSLWLLSLSFVMAQESRLWGKPLHQAYIWAQQHPLSRYAQSHAASLFTARGDYPRAVEYYRHMAKVFPATPGPHLLWVGVACDNPELMPDMATVHQRIQTATEGDTAVVSGLEVIFREYLDGRCQLLDTAQIDTLFDLTLENPHLIRGYYSALIFRYALFHAKAKRYAKALAISEPLAYGGNIKLRRERLIWLVLDGQFEKAEAYLKTLRDDLNPQNAYKHEPLLQSTERLLEQFKGKAVKIKPYSEATPTRPNGQYTTQ
jgi:hypothetical protein